jgi:hypothetical protein
LAACDCISAERAGRAVEADDRNRAAFVRHYYDRRLDDPANFHLVLAADRFRPDQLADVIVAAACPAAAGAPNGARALLAQSS